VSEKHTITFDYFDLDVTVSDEGDVNVVLRFPEPFESITMDYDTFREVIDAVGKFGLGMNEPYIVEYEDTREAIEA